MNLKHLLHELIILISSLAVVVYKVIVSIQNEKKIFSLTDEANYYKNRVKQYKDGVGEILSQQFKLWGLTESEKDVALLLIKGLSMKDIANTRGTSEATVRQQSSAVYNKSSLENRNQLSSYFLEDLF